MNMESVSKLYHGVETSDAFEGPFAVWDVMEYNYYRQEDAAVYFGRQENYDCQGYYDNSDLSLEFISENEKMFSFLDNSRGWCISQQGMLDEGIFSEEDYAEYARLKATTLKKYKEIREIKFGIDVADMESSGTPFQYPLEKQNHVQNDSEIPQRIKRGR